LASFTTGLPARIEQPAFRLVTATIDDMTVGFGFGHQLTSDTKWWTGATAPLVEPLEANRRTGASA
jgi:hypothetical protein